MAEKTQSGGQNLADAEIQQWLVQRIPQHERLKPVVISLLEKVLQEMNVEYLSVTGRVKNHKSAHAKISKKGYSRLDEQLTDMTGIRVITYLESQVQVISEIVRSLFSVDEKNSLDKSAILGSNKVGYRSVHFVCNLGEERGNLPEYNMINALPFEIQVRTVLQHAWAELTHDRSYKFEGGLPDSIQRKVNLHAGLLEVADNAFSEIAAQIDRYGQEISERSAEELLDEELNVISINDFIEKFSRSLDLRLNVSRSYRVKKDTIDELRDFGANTIGRFKALISNEFLSNYRPIAAHDTAVGFARTVMMYQDVEKYFSVWRTKWAGLTQSDYDLLVKKHGKNAWTASCGRTS